MKKQRASEEKLQAQLAALQARLDEAEETLRAIHAGEVDALVVAGARGEQIFTLKGADCTYRHLIETINEGAVTLAADGAILYSNGCFAALLKSPLEKVIGASLRDYVAPVGQETFEALLRQGQTGSSKGETWLRAADGTLTPVYLAVSALRDDGAPPLLAMVATDLTAQKRNEAIVAAEKLARSILEQAAEAIVVCDERGRITHASRAARRLCGQNPLFQSFNEVFPLQFGGGTPFSLTAVLEGETVHTTEVRLARSSHTFELLLSATPLRDSQNSIIGCVVTLVDITTRKWMETELRYQAALVDEVSDAIISTDMNFTIESWNKAAEAIYGWSAVEALGEPTGAMFNTVYAPGQREAATQKLLETGHWEGEVIQKRKDGRPLHILASISLIKDEAGRPTGTVAVNRNITERKQAEEALRISEQEFRAIFELNAAGLAQADPVTGRFMRVNRKLCDISGYTEAELLGMTYSQLTHPDDREVDIARIQAAMRGETDGWTSEKRYLRKDGACIWVEVVGTVVNDAAGRPLRSMAVIQDITQRKRAEEALRESEMRFRLALANAPVSVAAQDRDLRFIWAYNQRTVRAADVIGKTDTDVFPPEVAARLMALKRQVLENSVEVREQLWLTSGGRRVFLDLFLEPIRDERGQVTGVGIATLDLTPMKRIEEELRESERRLQQAQEMLEAVTAGTGVIIATVDTNFCYTFFNKAYQEEMKRLTGQDIYVGASMVELFAHLPEQQKVVVEEWSQVMRGERTNKTLEFGDSGLHRRVYDILHTPLRDAAGNVVGAGEVAYDVTEKMRAEEALRESEKRYRSLFNGMTEGFALHEIICDEKGEPCDYRFLEINPSFERLTGLKREEVEGKLKSKVLPNDDPYWVKIYGAVALTGESVHFENYSSALNQYYEVFAYCPAPRQFAVLFLNITERKQSVMALEMAHIEAVNERNRLEAVMEALPVGVAILDVQGGSVRSNRMFEQVWGEPRPLPHEVSDYAAYQSWWVDTGRPVQPEEWASARAIHQKETVAGQVMEIQRFDGRRAFVINSAAPFLDAQGQVAGCAVALQDITDLKRAEKNIESMARFPAENPNPVLRLSQDGVILYANEASRALLREWNCGVADPVPPIWRDRVSECFASRATKTVDVQCDGLVYSFVVVPIAEAGYVNLYGRDITLRKRAEEALQEANVQLQAQNEELEAQGEELEAQNEELQAQSEELTVQAEELRAQAEELQSQTLQLEAERERLRVIIDSAPNAILVADELGQVVLANPAAKYLYPQTQGQKRFGKITRYHPDHTPYDPHDLPLFRAAVRGETHRNIPIALLWPDGQWRDLLASAVPILDSRGQPYGAVGVYQDITAMKQAEEALRVALEKYRVLFESFPLGITISDKTGKIVETNKAAERLLNVPQTVHNQRDIGSPDWQIVRPDGSPMPAEEFASTRALRENRLVDNVEMGIVQEAGNITWINVTAAPIPLAGYGVAVAYGDITARRQAEQSLRESEERYRLLFDNSMDGILLTTPDGGIQTANAVACRIFGQTEEEICQAGRPGVVDESDPRLPMVLEERARTGRFSSELFLVRGDGACFPGEVSSTMFKGSDGRLRTSLIVRDITERKKKEEELYQLNRTLTAHSHSDQALIRATTEAEYMAEVCRIVVEDCRYAMVWIGFAEEGKDKLVKPVAHAGFEEGYLETLQLTWADTERGRGPTGTAIRLSQPRICRNMLTDPDFAPWREEALRRGYAASLALPLLAQGQAFGAITIYSKEPDPFSAEEVKLLSSLTDDLAYGIRALRLLKAHAQAEEALRETRDYLDNLLTYANAPIIVWDPNFKITRFNGAFERLTGLKANDVYGQLLDILFPEDQKEEALGHIRRAGAGEHWEGVEIPIRRIDRTVRTVLWNSATLYAADGATVIATIAQGQDITERKQAEAQIKAALAEKEVLLQEIHHRVKNNLQVLMHLIDMQTETMQNPEVLQMFRALQQRIQTMAMVHAKLYQAQDLGRIDFGDYLRNLTTYLYESLASHRDIALNVEADEIFVNLNVANPCGLIVNELVTNALKYAFPTPRRDAQRREEGNEIRVGFKLDKGEYVLTVSDNGVGLPPGFDWRATESLGLKLVNILAEYQLRGRVEAGPSESGRRKGTTFTIRFGEKRKQTKP